MAVHAKTLAILDCAGEFVCEGFRAVRMNVPITFQATH